MKCKIKLISLVGLLIYLHNYDAWANNRNNSSCGIIPGEELTNGYGPYDYTNPMHRPSLGLVLSAHFTPEVERLERGNTSSLSADIDYTLRAIPNYHRALVAISRYELQNNIEREIVDKAYSARCYFERAIYFQPKDAVTKMLYAIHEHNRKNLDRAEELYLQSIALAPKNPETHYNIGLLYVDLKQIEKAEKHAKIAYAAGHPLPGLKNRIAKAKIADN